MISIIMPTYNRKHSIRTAIQSVLNQDYKNWELIVVDDGSEDGTKYVVDSVKEKDSRVRYIALSSNGGVSNARNVGIEAARGDFIAYLDSDNYMYQNWLSAMMEYFERNVHIAWLYPRLNTTILDLTNESEVRVINESIIPEGQVTIGSLLAMDFQADPNGLIHKRDIFSTVRWDLEIQSYGDYEYAIQMARISPDSFAVHPFVLGSYVRTYGIRGMCSDRGYSEIISGLAYLKIKHGSYREWSRVNGIEQRMRRYRDCIAQGMRPIDGLRKKYGVTA